MAKPEDVRLLIAVPTMGSINTALVARLLHWQTVFPNNHLAVYFTQNVSPHDRARNHIVDFFLNFRIGPDQLPLTHLMMVDSDTVPPADAPQRLLSHDKDFVSGLTPIANVNKETHQLEFYDNCFESTETDEAGVVVKTNIAQRHTGLREIIRCGAACLLVSRQAIDALEPPYFLFETDPSGLKHTRSEDIYFCDTIKDAGFVLYADTDVVCTHHKTLSF